MQRRLFILDWLSSCLDAGASRWVVDTQAETYSLVTQVLESATAHTGTQISNPQKNLKIFVYYSDIDKHADSLDRFKAGLRIAVESGKSFMVDEDVLIAGTIEVPAFARIYSNKKWITQSKALTPLFQCEGGGMRQFIEVNCRGVGVDYVNSSAVYAAAGIVALNNASVQVENCQLINFSGAGVKLMAGSTGAKVMRSRITGSGRNYIVAKLNNYGACVVVDNGVRNWTIEECDLSLAAQGIVTGDDLVDVRIIGNIIHDIAGQHGAYIESVKNIEISKNIFFNIPLQAIKIQIGSVKASNASLILIDENKISQVGSHGILLTNPVGGSARLQNFVIKRNVFEDIGESAISMNSCDAGLIFLNDIKTVGRGFYIKACSELSIVSNSIMDAVKEGVLSVDLKNAIFYRNYFYKRASRTPGVGMRFTGPETQKIELLFNQMAGDISNDILLDNVKKSQIRLQLIKFN